MVTSSEYTYLKHIKCIQLNGLIRGTKEIHNDNEILRIIQETQCELQVNTVGEKQRK